MRGAALLVVLLAATATASPLDTSTELVRARLPRLPGEQVRIDAHAVVVESDAGRAEIEEGPDFERRLALAWMRLADATWRWSEDPSFRSLNGWHRPLNPIKAPVAANLDERGFAGTAATASDDLATFAAADLALDDASTRCRLLAHAIVLRRMIAALPAEARPARLPDDPACPEFDAWAGEARLHAIEVNLAAPSSASLGSLFGHLLLRLTWHGPAGAEERGTTRFIAFLAENDAPLEADPLFALKGLTGHYSATLSERSFEETFTEYVVRENRDLSRYELALTADERHLLLARLWSARKTLRLQYFFLQDNCATMLTDLLNGVVGEEVRFDYPDLVGAGPTAALDGMALARRRDGRPLLVRLGDTLRSLHSEAVDAERRRSGIETRLRKRHAPELGAAFAQSRALDAGARAEAHRAVARLLADDRSDDAIAWFESSIAIELHLASTANLEEEKRRNGERLRKARAATDELATRLRGTHPALGPTIDDVQSGDRDRRHRGYAQLLATLPALETTTADDVRRLAALRVVVEWGDGLHRRPDVREPLLFPSSEPFLEDQPFAAPIRALVAWERVTSLSPALLALQEIRLSRPGDRAQQPLAGLATQRALEETERDIRSYDRGWRHTGVDTTRLGWSIDSSGRSTVLLGGAVYQERLGDRRRHGFPGHTAFTFLEGDYRFGAIDGRLAIIDARSRLVGYRSLAPELETAGGWGAGLGFEAWLDIGSSLPRGMGTDTRAGAAMLVPILASTDLSSHLLASLGGSWALQLAEGWSPDVRHGPEAAASIEARWTPSLFARDVHFLEAAIDARVLFDVVTGSLTWRTTARAGLDVALVERLPIAELGLRLAIGVRHERGDQGFAGYVSRTLADVSIALE